MTEGQIDLCGKVAIVTGGGSGIGAASAWTLARAGAEIVVAGLNPEPLNSIAAEISASTGRQCLAVPTNVTISAEVDRMVAKTIEAFGNLDILVNSAGGGPYTPLRNVSDAEWREGVALNLDAAFYCARAAYPHMRNRGGSIISISSLAGVRGSVGNGVYSAAKAGLQMFTRVAAAEWGPNKIRLNCIAPGMILTEATYQNLAACGLDAAAIAQRFPLRRAGEPEDIASAVLFLASDNSSYMSGETLTIDGGPGLAGMIDVSDRE